MKLRILAAFLFLSLTDSLTAQSDDGWFTPKLSLSYISDGKADASFDYIFNLSNYISFGTGFSFGISDVLSFSPLADIRIRPCGHRNIMPALWLRAGYMSVFDSDTDGSFVLNPRVSLETGNNRKRFRYTFDIGAEITDNGTNLLFGAGLMF